MPQLDHRAGDSVDEACRAADENLRLNLGRKSESVEYGSVDPAGLSRPAWWRLAGEDEIDSDLAVGFIEALAADDLGQRSGRIEQADRNVTGRRAVVVEHGQERNHAGAAGEQL